MAASIGLYRYINVEAASSCFRHQHDRCGPTVAICSAPLTTVKPLTTGFKALGGFTYSKQRNIAEIQGLEVCHVLRVSLAAPKDDGADAPQKAKSRHGSKESVPAFELRGTALDFAHRVEAILLFTE